MIDPFDPVCSGHLDTCRSALAAGTVDRVLLVLSGVPSSCIASSVARWQMLNAACAGSKALIPHMLPQKYDTLAVEDVLLLFQKMHPENHFELLSAAVSDALPPSVREYCDLKGLYNAMPRYENAVRWTDQLFETLNPHRFAHSLSVARTSAELALRFGLDASRAEKAGLLHDCAKCYSLSEMQKVAQVHHLTDDLMILESASLLHSIVGAWTAQTKYGVDDPEILEAIMYHNTGCAGMSPLAMCVCLADFIEPNREPFPGLEDVRCLSGRSLERALLLSLELVAAHVRSGGKVLHPRTIEAMDWLRSLPVVQSSADSSGAFIANETSGG